MAAYTHPPADGRGGRINKDPCIYYCSADPSVAVAESCYDRDALSSETRISNNTRCSTRMLRALLDRLDLHDLHHLEGNAIYDPDN